MNQREAKMQATASGDASSSLQAGVPVSLESPDPQIRERLREEFERAYDAVATFWEERKEELPRELTAEHIIVHCFIQEWESRHTSLLRRCEQGGLPNLLKPKDPVVKTFIELWATRHTPIVEEWKKRQSPPA